MKTPKRRKAREWYATLDPDGVIYDGLGSRRDAIEFNMMYGRKGWSVVRVREVLTRRVRSKGKK